MVLIKEMFQDTRASMFIYIYGLTTKVLIELWADLRFHCPHVTGASFTWHDFTYFSMNLQLHIASDVRYAYLNWCHVCQNCAMSEPAERWINDCYFIKKTFIWKKVQWTYQRLHCTYDSNNFSFRLFVCVEVLRPSQPNRVTSSAVNLPNHTFTGQA